MRCDPIQKKGMPSFSVLALFGVSPNVDSTCRSPPALIWGASSLRMVSEASTEMKCNSSVITAAATDVSGDIDWSRIFTCPLVQTAIRASVGTYVRMQCLQCFGLC